MESLSVIALAMVGVIVLVHVQDGDLGRWASFAFTGRGADGHRAYLEG